MLAVVGGIPCRASAQTLAGDTTVAEMNAVRHARAVFARTNGERPTYRKVERTVLGLPTEGAAVVGLYRANELRKIEVAWYGEMGKAIQEFYLDGGRLAFMHESDLRYDRPFGDIVDREEHRYYFDGAGRIARLIDPRGRRLALTSTAVREAEREIADRLRHLTRAFAQPDSTYDAESVGTTKTARPNRD